MRSTGGLIDEKTGEIIKEVFEEIKKGSEKLEKTSKTMSTPKFNKAVKNVDNMLKSMILAGPKAWLLENLMKLIEPFIGLLDLLTPIFDVLGAIIQMALIPAIQVLNPLIMMFVNLLLQNKDTIIMLLNVLSPLIFTLNFLTTVLKANENEIKALITELMPLINELAAFIQVVMESEEMMWLLHQAIMAFRAELIIIRTVINGVKIAIDSVRGAFKHLESVLNKIKSLASSISVGGGGGCCFPANTMILMSDYSKKKIQDVKIGEMVICCDFFNNEFVESKVLEIEAPIRDHLYTLTFENNKQLQLTAEHPLFTKQGWKSIDPYETVKENKYLQVLKLSIDDEVYFVDNTYSKLIDIEYKAQDIQTYNLKSIDVYHNYFADDILVHNKGGCCFPEGTLITLPHDLQKPIEDVKVGEIVISYDFLKRDYVESEVLEIEKPIRDHLYTLSLENTKELQLTSEHPVYTSEGWKAIDPKATLKENHALYVQSLKIGDLVFYNKQYIKLINITLERKEVQTYNLKSIKDYHNFLANKILVHNKGDGWNWLTGYAAEGAFVPATPGGSLWRVGEGGENEYIIPESKMGSSETNYLLERNNDLLTALTNALLGGRR